jgi:8-oxo-dGTP diphosphatase
LCFIRKNQQLLLIRKKRGLGAGKVNAPGGKIEPGETPLDAAIRETQEEVGVLPLNLSARGILQFQFLDGYSLYCTVFIATDLIGTPLETPEAIPFWVPENAVPYSEMWEDDQHWLPQMLQGDFFNGRFTFDRDQMLSKEIEFLAAFPGNS